MSRLTEQQIDQQLENELLSFYNTVYTRSVPKGIITLFKDAIFHAAPKSHQIHVAKIRAIIARNESELLTGEVGMITNVLIDTPLDWVHADFDRALDTLEDIQKLTIEYNQDVSVFKKALDNKRRSLLQLVSPNLRNGGKIISSAQA